MTDGRRSTGILKAHLRAFGSGELKIILLKNLFDFIFLATSMSIKKLQEIFLFRFVYLACLAESTHMYATQSAD